MRPFSFLVTGFLLCGGGAAFAQTLPKVVVPSTKPLPSKARPPIDIVFAIDCSGSMGPVIETAKQKIWDIVNQAATANPTPQLRIGLLAYGNGSRTYREYDLSSDLDAVYENLATFKDEHWSDEYVGEAITKAVDGMSWSPVTANSPSLRTLYVVGNETARQGPIDFAFAAPRAKDKKIHVNAIYCGDQDGQDTWREFSKLGNGDYLEIARDGGSVMIATPYDKEINELSARLNTTYIPYGGRGVIAFNNQSSADASALRAGGGYAGASRGMAKAGNQYRNAGWDLVDKSLEDGFDIEKVPTEELPPVMKEMSLRERREYLKKKTDERAAIRKQLLELGAKRSTFLADAEKKSGRKDSLDGAVRGSFGGQAGMAGFGF